MKISLKNWGASTQLEAQHKVDEDAIEHMTVILCADLTASVISVGRVTRQDEDDGAEQRWGSSLHNRNGDNDTVTSDHSGASLFSIEGDLGTEASVGGGERERRQAHHL
jgi:hypothetical protein